MNEQNETNLPPFRKNVGELEWELESARSISIPEPVTAIDWIEPANLDPADHSARNALIAGLVKAKQGIGSTVGRDAQNPHLRNKYASLGAVIEAIEPSLLGAGIVVLQGFANVEGLSLPETEPVNVGGSGQAKWIDRPTGRGIPCPGIRITTEAVHVDGASVRITSDHPIEARKGTNWIQDAGTVISYVRRYHLTTLFNLGTHDDDAATGGDPKGASTGTGSGVPQTVKKVSAAQAKRYYAILNSLGCDHDHALDLLKKATKGATQSANDIIADDYEDLTLRATKSWVFLMGEQDPDAFEASQVGTKISLKDADQKGAEKLGKELHAELKRRAAAEKGE